MQSSAQERENFSFGIAYCKTGYELQAIWHAERDWPEVEFLSATLLKKCTDKVRGGDCFREVTAFPGYVFFRAPQSFEPTGHPPDLYRVLFLEDRKWQLQGRDEEFVKCLFDHGGKLNLSRAYKEGERVLIKDGPLKDLEGFITRIDKRNAKGQVELEVDGRKIRVWLCFEWVKEAEES